MSCLVQDTLHVRWKDQLVTASEWNNPCLMCELFEIHKFVVRKIHILLMLQQFTYAVIIFVQAGKVTNLQSAWCTTNVALSNACGYTHLHSCLAQYLSTVIQSLYTFVFLIFPEEFWDNTARPNFPVLSSLLFTHTVWCYLVLQNITSG